MRLISKIRKNFWIVTLILVFCLVGFIFFELKSTNLNSVLLTNYIILLTLLPFIILMVNEFLLIEKNSKQNEKLIFLVQKNIFILNDEIEDLYILAYKAKLNYNTIDTFETYCYLLKSIKKMIRVDNVELKEFNGLNQSKIIDNLNYITYILSKTEKTRFANKPHLT